MSAKANAPPSTSSSSSSSSSIEQQQQLPSDSVRKVVVMLRATADAPILKQNKFKISDTEMFVKVIDFLRRQLHRDSLFVYVNAAFSPTPDERIADLYDLFAVEGKLIVNYALTQAWG
eukprot:TRINITY_DN449_c0_g3_i2.p1 TRINITY_DN449_c0_g3~~TRINITY_DN449_c0_g3_i2.p1  ORF type:complete len:118 (+),score=34.47 TRINITY_DN449_c0_g3_i2:48-401(+)